MVTRGGASRRVKFSLVFVMAAFVAVFATSLAFASAKAHGGDQTIWFKDVTIGQDQEVRGDLDIVFGSVTCEDGGTIDGNVRTYGGSFDQRDGCTVNGRVVDELGGDSLAAFALPFGAMSSDDLIQQNQSVLKKLAWDVVIVFAFLLFPMRVRVALDRVESHPGLSFAAGTLALVGAIPIAILLLISVIGLPLIPLEFAALFAGLWIGNAAVALLIGRRLYELIRPHTTPSPLGALAVGLVVITAAETLPVVGWAVSALVILVGLGSALLAFMRETSFRTFIGGPTEGMPPRMPSGTTNPNVTPPMNRPA
jgi:hypothetical protein